MIDFAHQNQTVDGFPAGRPLSNEELFTLDVDILVPAALENQITAKNAADVRARVIIEGANGPTTPEAHRLLHERGVFIVPDILANAGGVTASYFEWVQNRHGYFWPEAEVNERLEAKMMAAFETVVKTARRYRIDLRTAAYVVAIDRVATVTRMRGAAPEDAPEISRTGGRRRRRSIPTP
jgi:glutamate dehydrogenase (NAD(P)+)